ncbi:MAG: helicase-related protein, partial [Gemmatimonadetes bacterium]|nr:helicase-related protein [Gemmatimonadota bacterium]
KDKLLQPHQLARFGRNEFNYIVVDEVHHGQSPTYRDLLEHFRPDFMLGMTATPVRLDRRDIFELFDYNKAYEVATHDVIERGYLVPYTYHGLRDDIDYSNIRYENNRYRIDDLEKLLVIPERNQAVLNQYLDKGTGDKAIGFCVSIKHAERMAEFFNEQGVGSAAIHSGTENRNQLIRDFRENRITVVFTVDLFNEGVDFPNVQVLLFLRPTESKTVFIQQLGRGLRLVPGKKRVRILDFIGNYKRANLIRDYLAKNKKEIEYKNSSGRTVRKIEYEYSTGCEVNFDATVETILDQQDREELGIGKPELTEAYYNVAEQTGKKPSRIDIDKHGEYRSAQYAQVFGSWIGFIREIGEYTEASYHYPQGTHVGHILAVLWYFGLEDRTGTAFDDKYIRLRGGLGHGRLGTYQRQIKYKLLAAMELGILEDDRRVPSADDFVPSLTPLGRSLRDVMFASLSETNLEFDIGEDEIPSTRMSENEDFYNTIVCTEVNRNPEARKVIYRVIFGMHAIQQMLSFLYQIARQQTIYRAYIYGNFFQAPFVKQYMDREGIVEATKEASRRRCPFLLNLLAAAGLIETRQNEVQVLRFVVFPELVRSHQGEPIEDAEKRLECLLEAWPDRPDRLSHSDLTILKELFGPEFLTSTYMFDEITLIEDL